MMVVASLLRCITIVIEKMIEEPMVSMDSSIISINFLLYAIHDIDLSKMIS